MSTDGSTDARATRVHREAMVIDGLNVSKWERAQFERMRAGGLAAANCTIAIWENFRETVAAIAAWYRHFRDHADLIRPVHSAEDIRRAKAEGRVGIIFGFQNASPFEDDLGTIEVFHRLGVRVCQLTYNTKNLVGDGCWERNDGGLSYFGLDVIREMNRVGMLLDLSHVGYRTTMDAIEASAQPCAITHAGCRSVTDSARNKTDEQLQALAAKGGVLGIVGLPVFITATLPATIDDYVRHIDYAVSLIGIDHVAIGTDHTEGQGQAFWDSLQHGKGTIPFYQFTRGQAQVYPDEVSSITKQPNLTAALLRRGYREEEVAQIMGGNWLRLFERVWQA